MHFFRSVIILLIASFLIPLWATGPTGTITGTVTDASGAEVPKALVTIVSEGTNAARTALTNDDGDFTVTLLPAAHYRVSVEKQGFRTSIQSGVSLDVDQTARVDFILQVGTRTDVVKVNDTPPIVQTDTSTLGQVVNGRQVRELPLNERNFLSFALLAPGSQLPVEGSENSTQGGAISVNGAREQSNNFLMEGVDNNDPYINQYVALPSIDAIQEFKVQSSDYSAEYGRSGGAQINVILKSGTNEFHGGAFEFLRNRNFDAKNFFDFPSCTATSLPGTCGPIPRFDRNQFGATLGGPIRKDKTFFFVSYEGLRLRQATTREATVPSQQQLKEAEGLVPPMFENPVGMAVIKLYPAANVGDAFTSNIYLSSPVIDNSENLALFKFDHHLGQRDTFTAHYSRFGEDRFNPFDPVNSFTNLPGYGSFTRNNGQNAGLSWTHVFTSAAVNELRLGFNRLRAGAFQQSSGDNISAQLGFPDVLTNPVDLGYPEINLYSFDGIGEPLNYPQDRHDTTVHLSENLAIVKGRNQFKFGADIRDIQVDNYLDFVARGDFFFESGAQSGMPGNAIFALAQLLAGIPDDVVAVKGDTFNTVRSVGANFYVQDDIHVVPRLLLNVGMRYEYNQPPVEDHNRFTIPDLSANSATCSPVPDCQFIQAGTNGVPRATFNPSRGDIAPRIGLAWRPLKTERWVVRAAYGIFYDASILNISIFPRFNPPFYDLAYFANNANNPVTVQNILSQPGVAIVEPNMIDRNFRDAYMQQWNVDLQYEIGPNWMVDTAYVGSKGTHLGDVIDRNQANPVTGLSPYPQFSSILTVESGANSIYNALQVRSERRVGHGLTFLAAYTFSKSIDDVSAVLGGSVGSGLPQNSQDLRADRALSDFNTTHRFIFSSVYDLPFGKWVHSSLPRHLVSDWQTSGILTVQTGSPFTVVLPASQSGSAIAAFGNPYRPDLIGNPNVANPSCAASPAVEQPNSWFNTCAFAQPATGQFGSAGRNILTGPGVTNLDFALFRNIPLKKESHRIQLRGEFFNLFNHPNFDIPNHTFGSPSFGQVLSANAYGNKPPRQIQLGFKYVF